MKTIKIKESTHKKLMITKVNRGDESIDKTINDLVEWYNWWKLPGSNRGKDDGNK